MTLTEVLAVWGIELNERQAVQLLEEMMEAHHRPEPSFVMGWGGQPFLPSEVSDDEG